MAAGRIEKYDVVSQESADPVKVLVDLTAQLITNLEQIVSISKTIEIGKTLPQAIANQEKINKLIIQNNNIKKQELDIQKKINQVILQEQRIKQGSIRTTNSEIESRKKTVQLQNIEKQGRIKSQQLLAAEQRAKAAKIRTDRLEQQGFQKTTKRYSSLITTLRSYLTVFAAISIARKVISNIVNTTKELDSLNFAMKTVITDQLEMAQSQEFLSRITEAYGAELVSTTNRYIKFRAAAQQSNMSARATQKIFESVTKVAGVLGLRTEELTGTYLALEQMLSKGKITTEELRRQLGERIPGAFGIMADAIGVTIPKLDKMLRKGEILSAETLPKFARQLEKAFSVENVERVDTLVAAQNRYTLAWQNFVKSLEASGFLTKLFNNLTLVIDSLEDMFGLWDTADEARKKGEKLGLIMSMDMAEGADSASVNMLKMRESMSLLDEDIIEIQKEFDRLSKIVVKTHVWTSARTLNEFAKSASLLAKLQGERIGLEKGFIEIQKREALERLNLAAKTTADLIRIEKIYRDTQEVLVKGVQFAGTEVANIIAKILADRTKAEEVSFKDQKNANKIRIENEKKAQQERLKVQEDFIAQEFENEEKRDAMLASIENQNNLEILNLKVKLNQELLNNDEVTADEERAIKLEIAKTKSAIEKESSDFQIEERDRVLTELKKRKKQEQKEFDDNSKFQIDNFNLRIDREIETATKGALERVKQAKNLEEIKDIEAQLATDILLIQQRLLEELLVFGKLTVEDRMQVQQEIARIGEAIANDSIDNLKKEEKGIEDFIDKLAQFTESAFRTINQLNANREARAQQVHDKEIALAGDSTLKRLQAERRFEVESAKIRQKQAIANKAQTAFEVVLNTAEWVSKFGFFTPLGILAGLFGAAELAAVLAEPIPRYAEGTKNGSHKGGKALVGDHPKNALKAGGSEIINEPGKKPYLSPSTPTIMDLPSGTEIIPNDEVQSILAQQAFNHTSDTLSMDGTNRILRQMRDKKSTNVEIVGKYKIISKHGLKTRIRI